MSSCAMLQAFSRKIREPSFASRNEECTFPSLSTHVLKEAPPYRKHGALTQVARARRPTPEAGRGQGRARAELAADTGSRSAVHRGGGPSPAPPQARAKHTARTAGLHRRRGHLVRPQRYRRLRAVPATGYIARPHQERRSMPWSRATVRRACSERLARRGRAEQLEPPMRAD